MAFDKRVLSQSYAYDWLGNTSASDDDAHGFYDRSLGTIGNGPTSGASPKPYQLTSADNLAKPGTRTGRLAARYDDAGNLTRLAVDRGGPCLPTGSACNQLFAYEWDEVGRLNRARRWDISSSAVTSINNPVPTAAAAADLSHAYDAGDQRVIKTARDANGAERHTVYIFDCLELRRAEWKLGGGVIDDFDYEVSATTEVGYLFANGVRLARLVYEPTEHDVPTITGAARLHVFFELGDHLGSTSVVLDKATGELVERGTYEAYGSKESDYRPERWSAFREDYGFTGKEDDVEVGLTYFGRRFLSTHLNRWVSADPLTVHAVGADLNLYAYVRGAALKAIDPMGLQDKQAEQTVQGAVQAGLDHQRADPGGMVCGQNGTCGATKAEAATARSSNIVNQAKPPPVPVAEAKDALPAKLKEDPSLRPVVGAEGVQGWTTESGGTVRKYSASGKYAGYAGDRPIEPTMSPLDVGGPAAARGLWALGGKSLQLADTGRRAAAQWHFQRTVRAAREGLTEAEAARLTSPEVARLAALGDDSGRFFGQAVEAAAGERLKNSWLGRSLYRPASGDWAKPGLLRAPNGQFAPGNDFIGRGVFRGLEFNATSASTSAVSDHLVRYPGTIIGAYSRF